MKRFEPRPGTPLAIEPSAVGSMYEEPGKAPAMMIGGVAILRIDGPLMRRECRWFDSYDAISSRARTAIDAKPAALLLAIDSPGGEASGCFELAAELRSMSAASGVPLVGYVDGMACSAAYAIASSAARIYAPPTAIVGSIGVIASLVDMTAALTSWGINVRLVTSGERKADGHPWKPIDDGATGALQGLVNGLAEQFFATVAAGRPKLTADRQRELKAGVLLGADAMDAGLVDVVVATLPEAIARLSAYGVSGGPRAARAVAEPMAEQWFDPSTVRTVRERADIIASAARKGAR